MGVELHRVVPGFEHPLCRDGEYIAGGHHMALHGVPSSERTAYQIFENVSEGTPVSPVFETKDALVGWLAQQGFSAERIETFLEWGFAPSFVVSATGKTVSGIDGLPGKSGH
jgi:hypothetical protein